MFYQSRDAVIKGKHEAKYWKGLKILMIQGLPIVLSQVKTGNTAENLLNAIRQII